MLQDGELSVCNHMHGWSLTLVLLLQGLKRTVSNTLLLLSALM
jgi:hypothetical protein